MIMRSLHSARPRTYVLVRCGTSGESVCASRMLLAAFCPEVFQPRTSPPSPRLLPRSPRTLLVRTFHRQPSAPALPRRSVQRPRCPQRRLLFCCEIVHTNSMYVHKMTVNIPCSIVLPRNRIEPWPRLASSPCTVHLDLCQQQPLRRRTGSGNVPGSISLSPSRPGSRSHGKVSGVRRRTAPHRTACIASHRSGVGVGDGALSTVTRLTRTHRRTDATQRERRRTLPVSLRPSPGGVEAALDGTSPIQAMTRRREPGGRGTCTRARGNNGRSRKDPRSLRLESPAGPGSSSLASRLAPRDLLRLWMFLSFARACQ
ncbi:hypothetical protein FKP32DRAFT_895160 [Trametes sanguinea]|nr:hypothetical protein FKP32DRAFT_895160 [Trametes sanguinea]